MQTPPPCPPVEAFATFLRGLGRAVLTMMGGERLSVQVLAFIMTRIREANQGFARLATRLAAGTYKPRRYHGRKNQPAEPRPRRQSPVRQNFGWLVPMVPDGFCFRSQLEGLLFRDPEMAALMAAAPASMARILRPVCWMLRLEPPPILARPAKPRPPRKTPPTPEALPAPDAPPPRPQPPEWLRGMRRSLPQFALARIRPPPHRA